MPEIVPHLCTRITLERYTYPSQVPWRPCVLWRDGLQNCSVCGRFSCIEDTCTWRRHESECPASAGGFSSTPCHTGSTYGHLQQTWHTSPLAHWGTGSTTQLQNKQNKKSPFRNRLSSTGGSLLTNYYTVFSTQYDDFVQQPKLETIKGLIHSEDPNGKRVAQFLDLQPSWLGLLVQNLIWLACS